MGKRVTNSPKPPGTDNLISLRSVCEGNTHLQSNFKKGLGALSNSERKKIKVPSTSLLDGSVNLDEAAKASYPHENRWDYALDYAGEVFFIEVHPANTSEIQCVIKKVEFVKKWLDASTPEILKLPGPGKFYWVSSGTTDLRILPNSPQARRLVLHKIISVGQIWDYGKIAK